MSFKIYSLIKDVSNPPSNADRRTHRFSLRYTTEVNSMISPWTQCSISLHRIKSFPFVFSRMLHSRYSSTENPNAAYLSNPGHVSVVKESVPTDVMAVNWVADDLQDPVAPISGITTKSHSSATGGESADQNECRDS